MEEGIELARKLQSAWAQEVRLTGKGAPQWPRQGGCMHRRRGTWAFWGSSNIIVHRVRASLGYLQPPYGQRQRSWWPAVDAQAARQKLMPDEGGPSRFSLIQSTYDILVGQGQTQMACRGMLLGPKTLGRRMAGIVFRILVPSRVSRSFRRLGQPVLVCF